MQPQIPRDHAEPVLDEVRHLRVEHPPVGSCAVRQEHGDAAAGVVVGEAASIELEVIRSRVHRAAGAHGGRGGVDRLTFLPTGRSRAWRLADVQAPRESRSTSSGTGTPTMTLNSVTEIECDRARYGLNRADPRAMPASSPITVTILKRARAIRSKRSRYATRSSATRPAVPPRVRRTIGDSRAAPDRAELDESASTEPTSGTNRASSTPSSTNPARTRTSPPPG